MNEFGVEHVFKRSGLAALSDLKSPEHQTIFSKLDIDQQTFLDKESEFRSPDYRWPRDALHHWSRIWEYPYVYYHLKEYAETLGPGLDSKVVDIGSATTLLYSEL